MGGVGARHSRGPYQLRGSRLHNQRHIMSPYRVNKGPWRHTEDLHRGTGGATPSLSGYVGAKTIQPIGLGTTLLA
ncbi:hypothetical protein PABY_05310 [Pyrodictium abyssi]|uniref:Uncharacterized protein n=1 Tax=Pyrodictium abyssi TaxID=54256 RepID=A0ABM8ITT0_9CREN|nr:hypothetical protein PABY_05310 [Pyrodictium abyssi]